MNEELEKQEERESQTETDLQDELQDDPEARREQKRRELTERAEIVLAMLRVLAGKLKKQTWEILILTGLVLIGTVGLIVSIKRNSMPEVERGEYRVVADDDALLKGAPTKLVVADGMLAAYFEDSGYFMVCDMRGKILFAVQTDSSSNGAGYMDYVDRQWTIVSKQHSLYRFNSRGELLESAVSTDEGSREHIKELRERCGAQKALRCEYNGKQYRISSGNGIQLIESGGTADERVVGSLPKSSSSILFFTLWLTLALTAAAVWIAAQGLRRRRRKEAERGPEKEKKSWAVTDKER